MGALSADRYLMSAMIYPYPYTVFISFILHKTYDFFKYKFYNSLRKQSSHSPRKVILGPPACFVPLLLLVFSVYNGWYVIGLGEIYRMLCCSLHYIRQTIYNIRVEVIPFPLV